MSDDLKRTKSGHLRRNPTTGHLVRGCSGCCTTPCPYCTTGFAPPVSVTFAGVNMQTACRYCTRQIGQSADNTVQVTAGVLDGTYALAPLPGGDGEFLDGCCWKATTTITAVLRHSDIDCTAPVVETSTAVTIIVGRGAAIWGVRVFNTDGVLLQAQYFTADQFTDACDSGIGTINNATAAADCGDGSDQSTAGGNLGYGGTATINF